MQEGVLLDEPSTSGTQDLQRSLDLTPVSEADEDLRPQTASRRLGRAEQEQKMKKRRREKKEKARESELAEQDNQEAEEEA